MSSIKGHTRNGSLLKLIQPALQVDGTPLVESKETLIPTEKEITLTSRQAATYLNLPLRSFNRHVIDHEIPFIEWGPRTRRFLISDLDKISRSLKTKKEIY